MIERLKQEIQTQNNSSSQNITLIQLKDQKIVNFLNKLFLK
jgi:hypothetical protein